MSVAQATNSAPQTQAGASRAKAGGNGANRILFNPNGVMRGSGDKTSVFFPGEHGGSFVPVQKSSENQNSDAREAPAVESPVEMGGQTRADSRKLSGSRLPGVGEDAAVVFTSENGGEFVCVPKAPGVSHSDTHGVSAYPSEGRVDEVDFSLPWQFEAPRGFQLNLSFVKPVGNGGNPFKAFKLLEEEPGCDPGPG